MQRMDTPVRHRLHSRTFDVAAPQAERDRRADFATIGTLLPYLWPSGEPGIRARVLAAVVFLIGAKATNVVVPVFFKYAVDSLSKPAGVAVVPVALIVAYGLARVLTQTFGELRDAAFAKVAQRAVREAGTKTFTHLHGLSLRFHLDRRTGAVSRAIERGSRGIEFLLNFMLFNILPTLVEILLVAGILWWLFGIGFALVIFACIGAYILFTVAITEWRTKFRRRMNETDAEAHTKAIDSLLNYETVKYFGNELHEERRFSAALASYEAAAVRSKVSLSMLNIGQGGIVAIGLIILMLMAGQGVQQGTMTIGDFVMVNTYLIQLYMPLNFLGFVYREIRQALTDMEHMFQLMREPAEIADAPGAPAITLNGGAVVFDRVSFAYDERRPVLTSVSFAAAAGHTVAVVGASGAGKSTIARLLYRFYDVSGGRILIDGQDIRTITQASLHQVIGVVPQDTVLFNDTIHYNIAYGRPGAAEAEIVEAARLARIDDFIASLPNGYQTQVGERGLKLSGGEKQRVAIARTILKNPRILIFDEATSALDTHTEKEIQASLRMVSSGRTTIVIAHRLSTVVDADEILVLDRGEVVERGRHLDLLARGGRYATMWARQQELEEARELLAHADAV